MKEDLKDFGKIRKAIRTNEQTRSLYENGYEESWDEYDNFSIFGKYFLGTLPQSYQDIEKEREEEDPKRYLGFIKYIEDTLEGSDLTAVEFGGPGSYLFSNFSSGFFKETVGVCLEDIRAEHMRKDDEDRNHVLIIGNVLDMARSEKNETLTKVKKELGRNKTNLIISRMGGPVGAIDKHPAIIDRIIRNWYSLLADNGVMFIQFAHITETSNKYLEGIKEWARAIKERFPEIDIQLERQTMRLHKKNGAPEQLPSLPQLFA